MMEVGDIPEGSPIKKYIDGLEKAVSVMPHDLLLHLFNTAKSQFAQKGRGVLWVEFKTLEYLKELTLHPNLLAGMRYKYMTQGDTIKEENKELYEGLSTYKPDTEFILVLMVKTASEANMPPIFAIWSCLDMARYI